MAMSKKQPRVNDAVWLKDGGVGRIVGVNDNDTVEVRISGEEGWTNVNMSEIDFGRDDIKSPTGSGSVSFTSSDTPKYFKTGLSIGDRVVHSLHGTGTIIGSTASGNKFKVSFDETNERVAFSKVVNANVLTSTYTKSATNASDITDSLAVSHADPDLAGEVSASNLQDNIRDPINATEWLPGRSYGDFNWVQSIKKQWDMITHGIGIWT
jgi:hypothetical protein